MPSNPPPGPVVAIEAISYAPVGAVRDEIWDECVVSSDISEPVKARFVRYALRCFEGEDGDFGAVEFTTQDGKVLKKQLTKIKGLPLDKENLERRAVTKEIAAGLSAKMAAAKGSLAGAIFVVQARIDGKLHLCVLKLDLRKQEIVALKATSGHRALFSETFERALPEETKKFRKGVIFPSPGDGDAWSVQYDHFADYWQQFVGARPVKAAKKAKEAILETAREGLREEGKAFTEGMVVKLEARLREVREPTPAALATAIKQATGMAKRVSNIEEKLVQHAGRSDFVEIAPVVDHQYEFRDGLKLVVPHRLVEAKVVTVDQDGKDVVIRIKQSPIIRKDRVGRPE